MGIFKVLVTALFSILLGCLIGCKPQPKKDVDSVKKMAVVKKDELPAYPTYLTKNYVLGKFDYTKDSGFVKVPKNLSSTTIYLRKEVLTAFQELQKEAKKDGVSFKIISGTRNFAHQKRIWNYKWNSKYRNVPENKRALKILEYSAMPGTSRHHWGTDIDMNNLNNHYFEKGQGKREYDWLVKNAKKFGFYQVYTSKENGRTGYNEEKWHWSYAPLSSIFLNYYNQHVNHSDMKGFEGSEFALKIDMMSNYVNGINPTLLQYHP